MKTFSKTDVGRKREVNQDYVAVANEPIGNLPNLLVVADGMGGHRAGDFASRFTVETLFQEVIQSTDMGPKAIICNAIESVNQKLMEAAKQNSSLQGMGTTLVVATVIERTLYFANIGDSRLYLLNTSHSCANNYESNYNKDNPEMNYKFERSHAGIRQLSKDHSLVQEMVRLGGIKAEEAKHHPDKNIITRAIGVKERVKIDFFEYRLRKGDVVLMCTDGLSNMLEDEEIFQIVKSSRDIVEAVEQLIERANDNGGNDNIGVVIAKPFEDEVNV